MPYCTGMTRTQSNALYVEVLRDQDVAAIRDLCKGDLFFLLTMGFGRKDINRDWLYERCREIEAAPNGYLDLWAREHYKSTLITYGLTIQDILKNPEITAGIFSHTRPAAKAFLTQIKRELEENDDLKQWFPDVLYQYPRKESPSWSADNGIIVKRTTNPKEATVEAWGLVDGQPIGKHFSLLIYDDVVTKDSVSTPDQIKKTTESWGLSLNLGAHGGTERYIGTRYHFNDTYREIMAREAATPRIYAATDDGKPTGNPVFLTREQLAKKRKMGSYVFACQMLQNPVADSAQGFHEGWLRYYEREQYLREGWPAHWNYYLLCDPAGEKKKENDYTVMWVIALADDGNYYLIDGIRDRLNLTERAKMFIELHRRYRPTKAGYEKYGKDSDIEHIKTEMARQSYRFDIVALGGAVAKEDRIRMLIPKFEYGQFFIPYRLMYTDYEGQSHDLIQELINDEYLPFPVGVHDDMMDCMARILHPELGAVFPRIIAETHEEHRGRGRTDQVCNDGYDPMAY